MTAHSAEELENIVVTVASGRVLQASRQNTRPEFRCRSHIGETASLFYLTSNFSSAFEFEPVDYLRFVFQLERHVEVRIGSSKYAVDPRQAGYVLPAGQPVSERHPVGHRSLALRISPQKLQDMAGRLLGREIDCLIVFQQPDPQDSVFGDFVRGAAVTIARGLGEIERPFQAAYWEAFEADIALRLLLHGDHSLSQAFRRPAPSGGRLQRVEEHIHEHWNKTLRLDDLAAVAGTSAKTVYSDFVRRHGETPHSYVKRLRLRKAHDMLKQHTAPSAMLIALRCGFTSFGHFARAYRAMFGELPSTTSKKPRP